MSVHQYLAAIISGEIPERDVLKGVEYQSSAPLKPYPLLFLPRNPVLFVPAKGAVHVKKAIRYTKPFRFVRLRPLGDRKDKAKRCNANQQAMWYAIKDLLLGRRLDEPAIALNDLTIILEFLPGRDGHPLAKYLIGLQSGGRSALRLLPFGRLLRIKGGEHHHQLDSYDGEIPKGGSIESYVEDEIKAHAYLKKRTPEGFLPYNPVGYFDYRERFNGSRIWAGLFEVQGDTRLDEVLHTLRGVEELLRPASTRKGATRLIFEQIQELSFALGKVAGIRFRQLEQTGVPWSMKETPTNAHPGNMVVYDKGGKTTIGICDLDAAGSSIKSKSRRLELLQNELEQLLIDTDEATLISLPQDHRDNHKCYRSHDQKSTACRGFLEGHRNGGDPYLPTADVSRIIGLARSAEYILSAENTLREHGLTLRSRFLLSLHGERSTGFPKLEEYKQYLKDNESLLASEFAF